MKLPNPVARLGDKVDVLNYRKRPPEWEAGRVAAVQYEERYGRGFSLSYEVHLDRTPLSGCVIRLYTSKIRKL